MLGPYRVRAGVLRRTSEGTRTLGSNEERHVAGRSAPRAMPIVFGPRGAELSGWYHPPRPAETRSAAVVLCNPLGYEAICAHSAYRVLAERLAEAGFATLRFDYAGTGDSAGDEREPGRMAAALASVQAAFAEARARSGAHETAVIGVQMGATLAAIAASARGGVDSAVLWAPIDGRTYVRQIRAMARLNGQARPTTGPQAAPNPSTDEEAGGFVITAETIAELQRLDPTKLTAAPARRALIVPRATAAPADERLSAALTAQGAATRTEVFEPAYAAMMLDPHESVVPDAVIEAMVAFLCEAHPREVRANVALTASTPLSASPAGGPHASVIETPVCFGAGERLSGVLARPHERASRRPNLGVVLVSVGAIHRVGPGRLYVTLARALGALGVPSLRFDLSGIGDSRPAHGATENVLYAHAAGSDVRAAMDCLVEQTGARGVVVLGLCAGAHAAFEAARADHRTAGLWLVNQPVFERPAPDAIGRASPKAVKSTDYYWRALLLPDTWKRAVRGELDLRKIAHALGERIGRSALTFAGRFLARARGRSAESDVARAFATMCGRGTDVVLVYGEDEPGLDEIRMHMGTSQRLDKNAHLRLETVRGTDHAFASRAAQSQLIPLLLDYVRDRLEPWPGAQDTGQSGPRSRARDLPQG